MATDVGLPALSRRLDAIADVYKGDLTQAGHNVGKGARTEASSVARDVTGGDQRLSHMGRKGARLGMRYDVEDQGKRVIIKLTPAGPWMLTERGAKPHTIKPKAARARGIGSGWGIDAAVWAPGYAHPTRKPFTHPGAPGKSSIRRTMGRIRGRASADFHEGYVKQLAQAMGA